MLFTRATKSSTTRIVALVRLLDHLERILNEAAKGKASKAETDLGTLRQVTAQHKGRIADMEA